MTTCRHYARYDNMSKAALLIIMGQVEDEINEAITERKHSVDDKEYRQSSSRLFRLRNRREALLKSLKSKLDDEPGRIFKFGTVDSRRSISATP